MSEIKRNANYTGDDENTTKAQAQADGLIAEIGRLKLKNDSTLTALDRMLIQETVVLWDNAYDALDKETLLDLMTDDVEFESVGLGVPVKGRQGMSQWWDTFTKTFTGKRHLLTNFVIVGQGDNAKALSYLTVFERILHTQMIATTIYYDELVKQDGAWKISKRLQILDPGMSQTEYGQSLFKKYAENSAK